MHKCIDDVLIIKQTNVDWCTELPWPLEQSNELEICEFKQCPPISICQSGQGAAKFQVAPRALALASVKVFAHLSPDFKKEKKIKWLAFLILEMLKKLQRQLFIVSSTMQQLNLQESQPFITLRQSYIKLIASLE